MPCVSELYYFHIATIIENMGLKRDDINAFTSIDLFKTPNPKIRIDFEEFATLLTGAGAALGDPHIGINISSAFRISTYGRLASAMAFCQNIEEAAQLTQRYTCLVHTLGVPDIIVEASKERNVVKFIWPQDYTPLHKVWHWQIMEYIMTNYVMSLNWLAWGFGKGVEKVTFKHKAETPKSAYNKVLGCDLEFEAQDNMIILDHGVFSAPLPTANRVKLAQLKPKLDRMLASYNLQKDLGARVKHKVADMMRDQQPTLSRVATEIQISERTLKRYLKDSGTSFRAILNNMKKELCESYLKEGYSFSQIAELLWYCDQSAFTRAFKNWYGVPPSQIHADMFK